MIKVLGTPNKASATQLQYWLMEDEQKTILTININETSKQITGYVTSVG
jgi:hypothetical protein